MVEELDLRRHGYHLPGRSAPVVPVRGRHALALWNDEARPREAVAALSPADVDGYLAYERLFARIRDALARGPERDTWLGDAPDRAEIEALLATTEALDVRVRSVHRGVVERQSRDERLRTALTARGQSAPSPGPRDTGTAMIHVMHTLGPRSGGRGATCDGGMGRVSFAIADAAREAGAVIAAGVAVAAIVPGEGVRLDGGDSSAPAVSSNADPMRTSACSTGAVPRRPSARRSRLALREPGREGELRAAPAPNLRRAPDGGSRRTGRR